MWVPRLPQPYRMIDKVLQRCVERAVEHADARAGHSLWPAPSMSTPGGGRSQVCHIADIILTIDTGNEHQLLSNGASVNRRMERAAAAWLEIATERKLPTGCVGVHDAPDWRIRSCKAASPIIASAKDDWYIAVVTEQKESATEAGETNPEGKCLVLVRIPLGADPDLAPAVVGTCDLTETISNAAEFVQVEKVAAHRDGNIFVLISDGGGLFVYSAGSSLPQGAALRRASARASAAARVCFSGTPTREPGGFLTVHETPRTEHSPEGHVRVISIEPVECTQQNIFQKQHSRVQYFGVFGDRSEYVAVVSHDGAVAILEAEAGLWQFCRAKIEGTIRASAPYAGQNACAIATADFDRSEGRLVIRLFALRLGSEARLLGTVTWKSTAVRTLESHATIQSAVLQKSRKESDFHLWIAVDHTVLYAAVQSATVGVDAVAARLYCDIHESSPLLDSAEGGVDVLTRGGNFVHLPRVTAIPCHQC